MDVCGGVINPDYAERGKKEAQVIESGQCCYTQQQRNGFGHKSYGSIGYREG